MQQCVLPGIASCIVGGGFVVTGLAMLYRNHCNLSSLFLLYFILFLMLLLALVTSITLLVGPDSESVSDSFPFFSILCSTCTHHERCYKQMLCQLSWCLSQCLCAKNRVCVHRHEWWSSPRIGLVINSWTLHTLCWVPAAARTAEIARDLHECAQCCDQYFPRFTCMRESEFLDRGQQTAPVHSMSAQLIAACQCLCLLLQASLQSLR